MKALEMKTLQLNFWRFTCSRFTSVHVLTKIDCSHLKVTDICNVLFVNLYASYFYALVILSNLYGRISQVVKAKYYTSAVGSYKLSTCRCCFSLVCVCPMSTMAG